MKRNHFKIFLILIFSLLPGLPQLYQGRRRKALSLFVIDAGIILTVIFSSSYLMKILVAGIYIVTFLPSCLESYQTARYGANTIDTGARWYVTILLLTTGFSALPLLWQSRSFSRRAKYAWSVAVPVLAILFFAFLGVYWDTLEAGIVRAAGQT